MAKIVRNVENVDDITVKNMIIELEEIEFIGDDGRSKTFKLDTLIPISYKRCTELDDNVDWDSNNFHFLACTGDEVIIDKEE